MMDEDLAVFLMSVFLELGIVMGGLTAHWIYRQDEKHRRRGSGR